jgi:outer membrane receptor for ferrienterochelin and colicin
MNNLPNIALFLNSVMKKILLLIFLIPFAVKSQTDSLLLKKDSLDFYDMSLDELMKLKAHGLPSEMESFINSLISVASKKPLNVRESPSVVTLITEEEIKNSGARDLIDVLRLVPGIEFGVDVEGVVGIGMRGNWAIEGKVLVLLDGQELNETVTGTVTFGNRYPVEHIKRIEIIRGPGSAIYGGYAKYGVINIVTKQAEDLNGVNIITTYGLMEKDYGRKNISISAGKKLNDFKIAFSGFIGQSQRSDQVYRDYWGSSYSMAGNSSLNPTYGNLSIAYKGFSLRAIADYYNCVTGDGYGIVIKQGPVKTSFNYLFSELKYVKDLNKKLNVSAKINYKNQSPWKSNGYDFDQPYFVNSTRVFQNLSLNFNSSRKLSFVFGSECYQDFSVDRTYSGYFLNGENKTNYQNYAGFFQSQLKLKVVNLIIGTRFDSHNVFGSALVPRVGLTKRYDKFHYKILFSRAFKSPTIDNINYADSKGIKPEYTNVYEAEIGYKINKNSFLSINAYDINTSQVIVYYTSKDSTNTDYYSNFGYTGSRGIEIEYRFKENWGYFNLNYAHYSSSNESSVDLYLTPVSKSLLGFANHRINFNSGININKNLSINSSASYFSKRWFVSGIDTAGNSIQDQTDPILLLNLFLRYQTPLKGLNIGIGVYDALNSKFNFIQPYDGGHAPLPGPSREFIFRLEYNLNFKK